MKKMIILTGFERYGKYSFNLSSKIVNNFKNKLDDYEIKRVVLPVNWKKSVKLYKNLLTKTEINPKCVILLGVYPYNSISMEKIAWNFAIGNDINNKVKFGLIKIGPRFYIKTGLDLKKIYSLLRSKLKIKVSYFPGFYLCNYIYFWALYLANEKYPVIFIHIPYNGKLDTYLRKIEIIIKLIIKISK